MDVYIGRGINVTGLGRNTNTQDSTGPTVGAYVVTGGLGVGKTVSVGENVNVGGAVTITGGAGSSSPASGALIVQGGAGVSENLNVGGHTTISGDTHLASATTSTDTNIGALVVDGGVCIGEKLNVLGITKLWSTEGSAGTTSGALQVLGGAGIQENLWVGGTANVAGVTQITDTSDSSALSTGAFQVSGGASVAKNLWIGGTTNAGGVVSITDPTQSTTVGTGALVVSGGSGIGGNLTVGGNESVIGNLTVGGTTSLMGDVLYSSTSESTNTDSGALQAAGGDEGRKAFHRLPPLGGFDEALLHQRPGRFRQGRQGQGRVGRLGRGAGREEGRRGQGQGRALQINIEPGTGPAPGFGARLLRPGSALVRPSSERQSDQMTVVVVPGQAFKGLHRRAKGFVVEIGKFPGPFRRRGEAPMNRLPAVHVGGQFVGRVSPGARVEGPGIALALHGAVQGQFGLLVARETIDGRYWYSKDGQTAGFSSYLRFSTSPPAAVVLLTNAGELAGGDTKANPPARRPGLLSRLAEATEL
jgi:hypothetical protein